MMQNDVDQDLPDDLQDELMGEHEATAAQIAALTNDLVKKRTEAKEFRKASGIEGLWLACEEAYVGIDDSNRSEFAQAKWSKPTSMSGPVTTDARRVDSAKSNAFVRLTSRYVDAGTARLAEILLPVDDKAFSLAPDPVPELVKGKDDLRAVIGVDGQPIYRDQTPEEIALAALQAGQAGAQAPATAGAAAGPAAAGAAGATGAAGPASQQPAQAAPPGAALLPSAASATSAVPQVPMTVADYAKAQLETAEDAADRAEQRIYGQMIDSNYPAETRKVVFDAGRIGVGVLKGPFPDIDKSQAMTKGPDGQSQQIEIIEKVVAKCKWVDPWNIYPDPACGENIHDGDYILERDKISSKKLKALKKQKGYIARAIDQVIEEGPDKANLESDNPNEPKNKSQFTIWYMYGTITSKDMTLLNPDAANALDEDQEDVYAILTMVNDTIIRATLNPLDSGRFPYNAFPWARRPGSWTGVGIAEQVSMPQRMVNGGTRTYLQNAGVSAGSQFIIDRLCMTPADGNWSITPDKIWWTLDETTVEDVRKAFAVVQIPNVGEALMNLINYAFKLAEEQSNIPLIAQGQGPERLPGTFGEAELLNSNANTMLRNIAYSYDDHITEPVVHAFYEYNLLDPEVPNDEKGAIKINAHGSASLVERAIQEQAMQAIGQLTLNPAFELKPANWAQEFLRSKRFDPRKFRYSDQELEQLKEAPASPPVQVQVATLKAQSDQAIAQGKAQAAEALQQQAAQADQALEQAKQQAALQLVQQQRQQEQADMQSGQSTPHMAAASARIEAARIAASSAQAIEQSRAQSEQAYAANEAQMARDNAQADIQKLQLQRELAILQYSTMQKISLQDAQTQLAKTSMIEQTKRQLAAVDQRAQTTENQLDRGHDMAKHITNLQADATRAAPPDTGATP